MARPKIATITVQRPTGLVDVRVERHEDGYTFDLEALGMPFGGHLGYCSGDSRNGWVPGHHEVESGVRPIKLDSISEAAAYVVACYEHRVKRAEADGTLAF